MVEVSTSILTVKKEGAAQIFYNIETAKTNYFHIDVMDGKFVESNNSEIMHDYATTLKHISNVPLDVHLMVENIKEYVDEYLDLNPNIITFHIEVIKNKEELFSLIKYIKENGVKVGLAVSPNTKIEDVYEYLEYIHMVLVMTVEPGKGGQKLLEETINKIETLSSYVKENGLEIDIEADGGINLDNCSKIKNAGVNIIVAGSSIINSEDYNETIKALKA